MLSLTFHCKHIPQFIHFPVDRHLVFRVFSPSVLAVMNKLPVNIPQHGHIYFRFSYILLRSRSVRAYGKCLFKLLRNCLWFFKEPAPFYTPTSNISEFLFLHVFINTIICNLILVMPVYLMVSHVVLIFISLVVNDVEHLLCAYWPFLHVLWGNVYSDPEPPSFFFIGRGNKDHGKYSKVL